MIFLEKPVDNWKALCYNLYRCRSYCDNGSHGGLAQLGERLHGMQEVRGSIPLLSTTEKHAEMLISACFFFLQRMFYRIGHFCFTLPIKKWLYRAVMMYGV